jgi:hypothetical protein
VTRAFVANTNSGDRTGACSLRSHARPCGEPTLQNDRSLTAVSLLLTNVVSLHTADGMLSTHAD